MPATIDFAPARYRDMSSTSLDAKEQDLLARSMRVERREEELRNKKKRDRLVKESKASLLDLLETTREQSDAVQRCKYKNSALTNSRLAPIGHAEWHEYRGALGNDPAFLFQPAVAGGNEAPHQPDPAGHQPLDLTGEQHGLEPPEISIVEAQTQTILLQPSDLPPPNQDIQSMAQQMEDMQQQIARITGGGARPNASQSHFVSVSSLGDQTRQMLNSFNGAPSDSNAAIIAQPMPGGQEEQGLSSPRPRTIATPHPEFGPSSLGPGEPAACCPPAYFAAPSPSTSHRPAPTPSGGSLDHMLPQPPLNAGQPAIPLPVPPMNTVLEEMLHKICQGQGSMRLLETMLPVVAGMQAQNKAPGSVESSLLTIVQQLVSKKEEKAAPVSKKQKGRVAPRSAKPASDSDTDNSAPCSDSSYGENSSSDSLLDSTLSTPSSSTSSYSRRRGRKQYGRKRNDHRGQGRPYRQRHCERSWGRSRPERWGRERDQEYEHTLDRNGGWGEGERYYGGMPPPRDHRSHSPSRHSPQGIPHGGQPDQGPTSVNAPDPGPMVAESPAPAPPPVTPPEAASEPPPAPAAVVPPPIPAPQPEPEPKPAAAATEPKTEPAAAATVAPRPMTPSTSPVPVAPVAQAPKGIFGKLFNRKPKGKGKDQGAVSAAPALPQPQSAPPSAPTPEANPPKPVAKPTEPPPAKPAKPAKPSPPSESSSSEESEDSESSSSESPPPKPIRPSADRGLEGASTAKATGSLLDAGDDSDSDDSTDTMERCAAQPKPKPEPEPEVQAATSGEEGGGKGKKKRGGFWSKGEKKEKKSKEKEPEKQKGKAKGADKGKKKSVFDDPDSDSEEDESEKSVKPKKGKEKKKAKEKKEESEGEPKKKRFGFGFKKKSKEDKDDDAGGMMGGGGGGESSKGKGPLGGEAGAFFARYEDPNAFAWSISSLCDRLSAFAPVKESDDDEPIFPIKYLRYMNYTKNPVLWRPAREQHALDLFRGNKADTSGDAREQLAALADFIKFWPGYRLMGANTLKYFMKTAPDKANLGGILETLPSEAEKQAWHHIAHHCMTLCKQYKVANDDIVGFFATALAPPSWKEKEVEANTKKVQLVLAAVAGKESVVPKAPVVRPP